MRSSSGHVLESEHHWHCSYSWPGLQPPAVQTSSSSDGIPPMTAWAWETSTWSELISIVMSTSLERKLATDVVDRERSCAWGIKYKSWLSQLSNMPLGTGGPLGFLLFPEVFLNQKIMRCEKDGVTLCKRKYSCFWFGAAFLFWPLTISTCSSDDDSDGIWLRIFWISLRPAIPCFCFLLPLAIPVPASWLSTWSSGASLSVSASSL